MGDDSGDRRYDGAMKRRTVIVGVAGLGAMGLVGWLGWRESSRRAPQANRAVRAAAPAKPDVQALFDATLPDVQGQQTPVARWRGQPLVVNFWATWCPPCVKEMPDLNRLAQSHPRAQFLGIAVDTAKNVTEFVAKVPVAYPILVAGHSGIDLVRALGNPAGGLPFTVLVTPGGVVAEVTLGPVDPEVLGRQVQQLVAGSRA